MRNEVTNKKEWYKMQGILLKSWVPLATMDDRGDEKKYLLRKSAKRWLKRANGTAKKGQ